VTNLSKVRVYELARELGMDDTKPLIKILKDMGYDVKSASNSLSDEAVRKIREVVAPHIDSARRETEVAQAKSEQSRKVVPQVAKPPERVVRIASKATSAEKEALMDRHRRKMAGETPISSAAEMKQTVSEVVPVAPPVVVEPEAPPTVVETPSPVSAPEPVVAQPRPSEGGLQIIQHAPARIQAQQSEAARRAQEESDRVAARNRSLPPDQAVAAEYRDRGIPQPPLPPPATDFRIDKPAAAAGGPSSTGRPGPKTREISPMRGGPGVRRPGGPGGPGGPSRPGMHQGQRGGNRSSGRDGRKRRADNKLAHAARAEAAKELQLPELISVSDLASRLSVPASDVIKTLIRDGQMVSINQALDYVTAEKVAHHYGFTISESDSELPDMDLLEEDEPEETTTRPPVVTVLGHVDHGKTSLLDAIRSTEVTATEAGGITQRIGAYTVNYKSKSITFIDTPGHEAFTQMRARGAKVTDIAILVVAADDGVMPQTIEAINHVKAAKVPIIVAVNKIDKDNAAPEKVLQQLTEYGLVPEAWGGDTICVQLSAVKRIGIDELLEMILLVAEVQDFKANADKAASGIILEAGQGKGLGPVATVLIQDGTLKVGDTVVVGNTWGRVRMLQNELGKKIKDAKPSFPAEIIGLSEIPDAGDHLQVVEDEKMARQVAEARGDKARQTRIRASGGKTTLEDYMASAAAGSIQELKLVVKADGQGSLEALLAALDKLGTGEVRTQIVHAAVGAIRESDIMLASASNAIIIGFNVRPDTAVKRLADQEGVDIRLYRVIYHMLEDVRKAMAGLLAPDISEIELGRVEVRQIFKITKFGKVAGCYVLEGKITRDSEIRVVREGIIVYVGKLDTLKRFKDDVKEVAENHECGLSVVNYPDLQEKDILEAYRRVVTVREDF
jgi:translation initiation factor IF-2